MHNADEFGEAYQEMLPKAMRILLTLPTADFSIVEMLMLVGFVETPYARLKEFSKHPNALVRTLGLQGYLTSSPSQSCLQH